MKPDFGEIIKFAGVGLAATAVHASSATALHISTGLSPSLVNIIGFLCAFIVSCAGHLWVTFKGIDQPVKAAVRFFILALSGFIASTLVMRLALSIPQLAIWQAQTFAILIIPPISYLGSKFWAFRRSAQPRLARDPAQSA